MTQSVVPQRKARLYEVGTPMPSPVTVQRSQIPASIKEAVRPLMEPDTSGFFLQWGIAWASILAAIAIAVYVQSTWLTVAVVLFVGTRQNVLALLMHEQTHWNGLRSNWGDYFCELFVAYPLLVTLEGYRRVHLSHHSYYFTDDDPDYIRKQGKEWTFPQEIGYFLAVLLRDLSGMSVVNTLKGKSISESASKINTRFYPPRWLRPAFLLLLVSAVTLTHSWAIFALYWLLPLLTVLQGIIRLGAITEHKYNLLDPSLEESTPLIELRWWEKLLLPNLNFTLHIYHHWFPAIPASKLPVVHQLCREAGLVKDEHVFRGYGPYIRSLLYPRGESSRASTAASPDLRTNVTK